jgi:hypothetical protein
MPTDPYADSATTTVVIGGTTIPTATIRRHSLLIYQRHAPASFHFSSRPGAFIGLPDPWLGKSCTVSIDLGLGGGPVLYFAGDVADRKPQRTPLGTVYNYTAYGLRDRGNKIPVVDSNTGAQDATWNDPTYLLPRMGRTVGQAILELLEMDPQVLALSALGIGQYVSTGTGAVATSTVAAGAVTAATVTAGGTGYAAAPTVLFLGGGGSGAAGTATVAGGAVTGITISPGGSGYLAPPTIVLSRLPAATVSDLIAINILPPYPMRIAGEMLFDAIDSILQNLAPHWSLHVTPTGLLRFPDFRTFPTTTLTMDVDVYADQVTLSRDVRECFQRVVLNGSPLALPRRFSILGGQVAEAFGHDGLTNTQAKAQWKLADFLVPGSTDARAVGNASIGGGKVVGVSVQNPGYGYASAPTVTIGGTGSGAAATVGLVSGSVANVTITAQGSGYTTPPIISFTGGSGSGARAHALISNGKVVEIVIDAGGSGYTSAPTLAFSGTGSGATATSTIASGAVTGITVTASGSGYTQPPPVTIAPPGKPGQKSAGTCTCPNTLNVVVTTADATVSWPANYWDQSVTGKQGVIYLTWTLGTGITATYTARIVANTSLAAGGISTVTIDLPMPLTNYNNYEITGTASGGSIVWRKYEVLDHSIGARMAEHFSYDIPLTNAVGQDAQGVQGGTGAALTNAPTAFVVYSLDGGTTFDERPIGCWVDPDASMIYLDRPAVTAWGTIENLKLGGAATDGIPVDVVFYIPFNEQINRVTVPADIGGVPQYTGDSHTVEGLARTKTISIREWIDPGNVAFMTTLAQSDLDSMKNAVVEGEVQYDGILAAALVLGMSLNVVPNTGDVATGWDTAAVPVVSCEVHWGLGDEPLPHTTVLGCCNRRGHYNGGDFVTPRRGAQLGNFGEGGAFTAAEGMGGNYGMGAAGSMGQMVGGGATAFGAQAPDYSGGAFGRVGDPTLGLGMPAGGNLSFLGGGAGGAREQPTPGEKVERAVGRMTPELRRGGPMPDVAGEREDVMGKIRGEGFVGPPAPTTERFGTAEAESRAAERREQAEAQVPGVDAEAPVGGLPAPPPPAVGMTPAERQSAEMRDESRGPRPQELDLGGE